MSTPFYDLASLVVVPSGYKASKVYAQKPLTTDGQLTFSRASTATRVNSAGLIETVSSNVPRLDYQGSTCPKLLLEPQRSNSILYSSDFTNWISGSGVTVSANATTSPAGDATADEITNISATPVYLYQLTTGSASTWTLSFFAKKGTNKYVGVSLTAYSYTSDRVQPVFNLETGTLQTVNTSGTNIINTSNSITAFADGWYRITVTGTFVAGVDQAFFVLQSSNNTNYNPSGGSLDWSNATTGTIYYWGAQAEAGAYATSIIPTTSAAVTRLVDNCLKTGIGSLIGTEFTLYYAGRSKTAQDGGITRYMAAKGSGGLYNSFVTIEQNGANIDVVLVDGSAVQRFYANTPLALNTNFKVAVRAKSGSIAFYVNGNQIAVSTNTYTMTSDAIYVGYYVDGGVVNSALSEAMVLPSTMTNAQLAELTAL